MDTIIQLAQLEHQDKTCIIIAKDQVVFTSTDFGVKPMVEYYQSFGTSKEPLTVIDKIMGKGAVILAILCGAKTIISPKMSEVAYEFAKKKGLEITVETIVPMIINRTKDGRCPVETAVLDIDDVSEGYKVILETLAELRKTMVN